MMMCVILFYYSVGFDAAYSRRKLYGKMHILLGFQVYLLSVLLYLVLVLESLVLVLVLVLVTKYLLPRRKFSSLVDC